MKELPLVSIALCTYNGERYIRQQLDSILSQSYSNIEIVIVDDNSTDNTYKILSEYREKNECINLSRNNINLGFNGNFEKALSLCNGEYLAFSDQDDIWDSEKISCQVENIGDNVLIYHDSLFIDSKGSSLNTKISHLKNMYEGADPRAFLFNNCVSGHSILMVRELIDDILPFPKNIFYDWWVAFIALNKGSIKYLPDVLVNYRKHDSSITNENLTMDKSNNILTLNCQIEIFCNNVSKKGYEKFFQEFMLLIKRQKYSNLNFRLVWLMLINVDNLFYIKRKNIFSKLNKVLKNTFNRELRV